MNQAMSAPQMPQILKHVDNYIVFNEKLGGGQFSQVYKAMDKNDKTHTKHFAVKVIPMSSTQYNKFANYNQLLQKEIEILLKARHENLICMHDLKQTPNNLYLFLDYCNGGDLRHYITKKKNRLAEEEALELFKQMCAGYQALNEKKIIHRDLKPENILLHDNKIKIGDFGFARMVSDLDQAVRMTQKCSPLYAPPQILQNEKYSSKCDVWSMGCIFFEMLYGRPPFTAQSIVQLVENIKKLVGSTPYVLPTYPPIEQEAKNILQRMLMFHEKDRISWDEIFKHSILSKNTAKKLVEIETSNATNPLYQSIRKNVDAVWENTLNQQQQPVLVEINRNTNNNLKKNNAQTYQSPTPSSLVTPALSPKTKRCEGSQNIPTLNDFSLKSPVNEKENNTLNRAQSMNTEENKKENSKTFENRPERAFSTAWQTKTTNNIDAYASNNHGSSVNSEQQFYSHRPSEVAAVVVEGAIGGAKNTLFRDRSPTQRPQAQQYPSGGAQGDREQNQQQGLPAPISRRQYDQGTQEQFQTQPVSIVAAPRSTNAAVPSWYSQTVTSGSDPKLTVFTATAQQFSPTLRQTSPPRDYQGYQLSNYETKNKEASTQINQKMPQYGNGIVNQQQSPKAASSSNISSVPLPKSTQAILSSPPSLSNINSAAQISDTTTAKVNPNNTQPSSGSPQFTDVPPPPSVISKIEQDKELSENQKYVLYMKQIKLNESEKAFIRKIDNFFKFLRRRALFANAALLNFWNSTRQFKLDPSTQCSILYCLCSYYYIALEQLRSVLYLETEQKLIKKDGFEVYQRSSEYQITKEIINADVIEAKQLFADIQPFLLSEIHRANQITAPEAVLFSKFIDSQNVKKHDEFRVKLQPLFVRALDFIDLDSLDKTAAKGVHMTQIFTNLEQFVPSKLYNDFDFNKFYDDHFNNPTLSQLKADIAAFSANFFNRNQSSN